jgi:hypothetical protein
LVGALTAVYALIRVDNILVIAFGNSLLGANRFARAALCAVFADDIRHNSFSFYKILLKIRPFPSSGKHERLSSLKVYFFSN